MKSIPKSKRQKKPVEEISNTTSDSLSTSSSVAAAVGVTTTGTDGIPTYRVNEWNQRVYVTLSRIPNSGQGLFAKEMIKKGEVICTYGGKLIDPAEARYLDPTYIAAFEPGKGFKLQGDNEAGDLGHYANSISPDFEEKEDGKDGEIINTGHKNKQKREAKTETETEKDENTPPKVNTAESSATTSPAVSTSSASSGEVALLERTLVKHLPPVIVEQNAKFNFTSKRYVDNKTRGRFDLVALTDIDVDTEIIVNYGIGYWSTMDKYWNKKLPVKPQTAIDRDLRAQRRREQQPPRPLLVSEQPMAVASNTIQVLVQPSETSVVPKQLKTTGKRKRLSK
jgi:hypothetical protein